MADDIEREKRLASEAAAQFVQDGMMVGLGTGSTVAYLLPALAARKLGITCVATSVETSRVATELGIDVVSFSGLDAPARLDIAIDGADQVAPSGWLVKGGGGAHTREKAVVAAADRFIVVVSSNKLVDRIVPPIPVELTAFGLAATLARLESIRLRDAPPSPDSGVIADYYGEVDDPATVAAMLAAATGVVEHGLFEPALVSEVIVGRRTGTERIVVSGG
jgi:ribose 5-phosphate isomerase A